MHQTARRHVFTVTLALLVLGISLLLTVPYGPGAVAAPADGTMMDTAIGASQPIEVDTHVYESNVIEVKFKNGLGIRLRNGRPVDRNDQALVSPQSRRALQAVARGEWSRSHSISETALAQLRDQAEKRSAKPIPDLNLYFRLKLPDGMEAAEAIALFRGLDEVETAFPVPKPQPPPFPPDYISPNDDNFDSTAGLNRNVYQRYLDAAPAGLDFRFAWSPNGGTGAGIKICDVEYGWNEDHADLPEVTLLGDEPDDTNPASWWEHGTAVIGQLAALNNGWGVIGMAYDAEIYFAAADTQDGGYNVADAITRCADALDPGDVILIEQQTSGPNQNFVPMEWNKAVYDAIETAVATGIVVVEAAGNGSEDLDDSTYSTGNDGHHPFEPENDSGAIIVGSANSPYTSSPRSRRTSSTYGSTVDLQGWGHDILTTGYGTYYSAEGQNLWYRHTFGGTSGASPMVTAAAAILQSTYVARDGSPASPATVRTLLRDTGTPQAGSDTIGPQPNLKAAIEAVWDVTPPAAPTLSPTGGTYEMPIEVTIDYGSAEQDWNNTHIRYTLDGSEPTPDSYIFIPEQDHSIYLLYGVTVKAKAYQYDATAGRSFESESTSATYVSSTPKVATPEITPGGGTYDQPHEVAITTDTPGATIRYRTDGRSPSFFYPGTLYTGPITLDPGTHHIKARGYKDGYYKSDVASSGDIIVNPTTLPAPTIYPDGGDFAGETTAHLDTTVIGADLRYTLDGSTPSASSPLYDTSIPLTETTTVKARTFLDGYTPSSTTSATFDVTSQAAAPTMTPNGGSHTGSVEVSLSTTTPGAEIRYTDNGAEPAGFSSLYEEPFVLSVGQHTVKAKAFLDGAEASETTTVEFTVYESPDGTVEDPTMTPFDTQYFVEPFTITMHTDTDGATIYYTMKDGELPADPTESDTPYTGPFVVDTNGEWYFKMRAFKSGASPSGVIQSGQLSLGNAVGTTNLPTITPNGGVFTNSVQVTISSDDQYETFFYTKDGSEPVSVPPATPPSQQYNGPFNILSPTTIRAKAYRPFFASGGDANADFTFVCDTPTITPAGGTFTDTTTISMTTGTSGATIYYTLNGSEPAESDTQYTDSFTLTAGSYPIKAKCFKTNYDASETALSPIVVNSTPVTPSVPAPPADETVTAGETVTFTVEVTGTPSPTIQWQRNGTDLAGETEPELVLAAVQSNHAGTYRVIAENSAGVMTSTAATLTVNDLPAVLSVEPADGATGVARNAVIVVEFNKAIDTGTVTYDVTPSISGITEAWSNGDSRLTLTHDDFAADTEYTVTIQSGQDLAGNSLTNAPYTWRFTTGTDSNPEADLALQKSRVGTDDVTAGERITYTFAITNNGPTSPVSATVVDVFGTATALTDVSGTGCSWTAGSDTVTCSVTDIAIGSSTQVTLVVTTSDEYEGTLTNSATVAPVGDIVDPNSGNDSTETTVTVRRPEESGSMLYLPVIVSK